MRLTAPASCGALPGAFNLAAAVRQRRSLSAPAGAPGPARLPEAAKAGVLVVGDEPAVRFLICDALEGAGFDVGEAADAGQVLDHFSTGKASCRVLVTDLDLGRGLDGLALAAEARTRKPALRVLYVTGSPERIPS